MSTALTFYLGKGLTESAAKTTVLVVEMPENHAGDGVNVLYADGSVEWLDQEKAEPLLLSVGFERVSSH